jgi:hypothetical protein
MARTLTLYEGATNRARIAKQGEIVQIVIDGAGAMVVETSDFLGAQKWAQSKPSTGNLLSDRGRFLERFSVLISRPGSLSATRGSDKPLKNLARMMKAGGFDLNEWNLPPEIRNAPHGGEQAELKEKQEAKVLDALHGEANTENTARGGDMDDPYSGMKK